MKRIFKIVLSLFLASLYSTTLYSTSTIPCPSDYPRSIFVPRQLSYNPIFENALMLDAKATEIWDYIFSIKPIYTKSVGSKFRKYFTIDHKCSLNVQEDGSGDISSLWFEVISSDSTFYSSQLSFHSKRKTYGSLLYFAAQLPYNFQIALNTAFITAHHDMHICERGIDNLGTCQGHSTIKQSFANRDRLFGKICGEQTRTGLDDIQLKVIYSGYKNEWSSWDIYGLLGIPTGRGSHAHHLFEPLVGSKHVQLGFGATARWDLVNEYSYVWSLLTEAKYRYAFKAHECRSFDLTENGQWSRYMLFVKESDKYSFFPAINNLTFKADVKPRSSFDFYLATHFNRNAWHVELGYDAWYRCAEKVSLSCATLPNVGIADLRGIAAQNAQSASTANISQGVQPGINQMTSDASFVPVTLSDINLISGAQASSFSNSFYGSIGYKFDWGNHTVQAGLNGSYERGSSVRTPDNVALWFSLDFYFSKNPSTDHVPPVSTTKSHIERVAPKAALPPAQSTAKVPAPAPEPEEEEIEAPPVTSPEDLLEEFDNTEFTDGVITLVEEEDFDDNIEEENDEDGDVDDVTLVEEEAMAEEPNSEEYSATPPSQPISTESVEAEQTPEESQTDILGEE